MRCKHVKDRLVPFLEGELSPAANALVTQHLRKCSRCNDLAHRLDEFELPEILGPTVAQSLSMYRQVDQALDLERINPTTPHSRQTRKFPKASLPAALAIVVLFGLTFWTPKTNVSPTKIAQPSSAGVVTPAKHWF